jgi:hypothetical protein
MYAHYQIIFQYITLLLQSQPYGYFFPFLHYQ